MSKVILLQGWLTKYNLNDYGEFRMLQSQSQIFLGHL